MTQQILNSESLEARSGHLADITSYPAPSLQSSRSTTSYPASSSPSYHPQPMAHPLQGEPTSGLFHPQTHPHVGSLPRVQNLSVSAVQPSSSLLPILLEEGTSSLSSSSQITEDTSHAMVTGGILTVEQQRQLGLPEGVDMKNTVV